MTVRTILTEPNKILRQVSRTVEKVTLDEKKLMDDMLDTMYAANGIGLAAIQIGVPKRIIVMDISKDPNKKDPRYFVNPIIKNKDSKKANIAYKFKYDDCLKYLRQIQLKNYKSLQKLFHNNNEGLTYISSLVDFIVKRVK